jgi:hypothetical protein
MPQDRLSSAYRRRNNSLPFLEFFDHNAHPGIRLTLFYNQNLEAIPHSTVKNAQTLFLFLLVFPNSSLLIPNFFVIWQKPLHAVADFFFNSVINKIIEFSNRGSSEHYDDPVGKGENLVKVGGY